MGPATGRAAHSSALGPLNMHLARTGQADLAGETGTLL